MQALDFSFGLPKESYFGTGMGKTKRLSFHQTVLQDRIINPVLFDQGYGPDR